MALRPWLLLTALLVALCVIVALWASIDRRPPEWDYANHLERALRVGLPSARAGVFNAGLSYTSQAHQAELLRHLYEDVRPDAVVPVELELPVVRGVRERGAREAEEEGPVLG